MITVKLEGMKEAWQYSTPNSQPPRGYEACC